MKDDYEGNIGRWLQSEHVLEDEHEVVERDEADNSNKVRIDEFSTVHNLNII